MKIGMEKHCFGMAGSSLETIDAPNGSWTATADCWAVAYMGLGSGTAQAAIYLDDGTTNTNIATWVTTSSSRVPLCFPVRKGQKVRTRNATGHEYLVNFYPTI